MGAMQPPGSHHKTEELCARLPIGARAVDLYLRHMEEKGLVRRWPGLGWQLPDDEEDQSPAVE